MSSASGQAEPAFERAVSLAPFTTLELGGPAKYFLRAQARSEIGEALAWAARAGEQVRILGGGSNLVIADAGVDGLVIKLATRGIEISRDAERTTLEVQAGESWEDVVQLALAEDLAGIECLTGIPGCAGATPIQNVGAYGQEVSERIEAVEVLDRQDLSVRWLARDQCGFGYRDSSFKRAPERYVVLAVRFVLTAGGRPELRYAELARACAARAGSPSLREVAEVVRSLRGSKSMLLDRADPNSRSAGSFFTNPVLSVDEAEQVKRRALTQGIVQRVEDVPSFAAEAGKQKLAAGWLIERAGVQKGLRQGAVGISSKHALALVHHGGGSTRELLDLARAVSRQVESVFGVALVMEPVCW
ncbi:MAG: UDP-N-acetylmuramate dehydrogenase [Myxococcales bacterium]